MFINFNQWFSPVLCNHQISKYINWQMSWVLTDRCKMTNIFHFVTFRRLRETEFFEYQVDKSASSTPFSRLYRSIKFIRKINNCQLPFLSIRIIKSNTSITTDIHCKSTDTHYYLNFKSRLWTRINCNITYCLASKIYIVEKSTIVDDPNKKNYYSRWSICNHNTTLDIVWTNLPIIKEREKY